MIWHRTRDNPPTATKRGLVLTYRKGWGYKIENAVDVHLYPRSFPWWAELTPPPDE